MPILSTPEAAETLAKAVEKSDPSLLREVYEEIYPDASPSAPPVAATLAQLIRSRLAAEEIVDLWNVMFPEDHDVYYNEETRAIHYNEEVVGHTD